MRILFLIAVGYVVALCLLRVFEKHLVFFPNYNGRLSGDWNPRGLPVEDVWFAAADGTKLHAWWIPNEHATLTFLAFHGNAANITYRAENYKFLRETPANILAVEYRGYGKSEGSPSEEGLYSDAQAAYQFLVTQERIPPQKIMSYGQSLGTAVAVHLAAGREVGAVVLEAPFPSFAEVARRKFWFFPGLSLLVRGQFDTVKRLRDVRAPILVVHCTDDPNIPYALGASVYEKASEPKFFARIEGVCHEEASIVAPAQYRISLDLFLARVVARP
jgi:fermentation-respiration switch protein FrsA (DUF1100 family)